MSDNTIQPQESIYANYDKYGELIFYVKEMVWEVGPFQLIIHYISRDEEDFSSNFCHTVKIENNSKFNINFNINFTPIKNWDRGYGDHGYGIYSHIAVSMFSGHAETAEELEELSQAIHNAAEAERVFARVLKERF